MKKSTFVLVASSLLVLASCGQTGSLLPSGATSVESAKAIEQFDAAVTATGSADALGVKLSGFNLSASCDVTLPEYNASSDATAATTSVALGTRSIAGSLSINDVNASVMAKGLTSKTVDDIALSAKFSGGVKANVALGANNTTKSVSFDYSSLSAAMYIANNAAYADLSNANFVALVNTITGYASSLSGGTTSAASAETTPTLTAVKYLLGDNLFSSDKLPLLSTTDLNSTIESVSATLTANSEYFKSYSYSNGNYALDFSLSKESLVALIKANAGQVSSSASEMVNSYADFISKNLTITACEEVVVYNEKGLVSNSCNIDVSFATTLGDFAEQMQSGAKAAMGDTWASKVEKASFKLAYSLAFVSGTDVVVETPADASSYVSSNPFFA